MRGSLAVVASVEPPQFLVLFPQPLHFSSEILVNGVLPERLPHLLLVWDSAVLSMSDLIQKGKYAVKVFFNNQNCGKGRANRVDMDMEGT